GLAIDFFVKAVYIHNVGDRLFYSNILIEDGDGEEEDIDSTTPDASAWAIRFDAPVYALEQVMDKAGVGLEVQEQEEQNIGEAIKESEKEIIQQEKGLDLSKKTKEELEKEMKEAVKKEDYELAARLRDELDKRS